MGSSFIFRNEEGRQVGYVRRGLSGVQCRLSEANAQVILLYEGATTVEQEMEQAGKEYVWLDEKRELIGAVALCMGRIIADTGEAARRTYLSRVKRQEKNMESDAAKPREERMPEDKENEKSDERFLNIDGWERRWPPSPCMDKAIYRQGKWISQEE